MRKSEIRKHYFQDKYVIISPKRAKRPHSTKIKKEKEEIRECFMCPDFKKDKSIYEIKGKDKKWMIKVIKNGFPAFTLDSKFAYGKQEIVIETPGIHSL